MGINRTSELKVIAVCICYERSFSISSVPIYYRTQSDIRAKSYCRLNHLRGYIFILERLDILRDSFGTQSDIRVKSYCRLNFLRTSIFNFECLDILQDSVGHPSKKILSSEFATSFRFQFGASRYITRLNRTSLYKVIVVRICYELPFSIWSISI